MASALLRPARPDDLSSVAAIAETAFPAAAFTRPHLRRMLLGPSTRATVAWVGSEAVGFVVLNWRQGASTCRIIDLAVLPVWRRQGVAAALLRAVLLWARGRGFAAVTLEVGDANWAALGLYRRMGFSLDRPLPGYYGPSGDGLRLVRWLRDTPVPETAPT